MQAHGLSSVVLVTAWRAVTGMQSDYALHYNTTGLFDKHSAEGNCFPQESLDDAFVV